jgi:Ca2+/Na+ antiporter
VIGLTLSDLYTNWQTATLQRKKSFLKIEIKNRKDMNRKIIAYFLIFASLILLILNITELNFDNLKENRYASIVSNLLLILAMIFNIRDINKKKNL